MGSINGNENGGVGVDCPGLAVSILTDSFPQSLLKKHETLENDFAVHETRVQDVCGQGEDILNKVSNWHSRPSSFSKGDWSKY